MPVINIQMFHGRTLAQKRAIAKSVTQSFVEAAGGNPQSVHVIFTEVSQDDWAVAGDLCSDRAAAAATHNK
ncbi:tautomerase family protein [Mesorhizobium sp. GR13]|uniref:tautomerase family protein n=1 Tax=Mesorhizobium sp. GR13 TaxID=2562308 RepID=UPI0010BFCBB1|nr:tautomerase family protein [Mesorhizobium sp. GR13]